MTIEWWILGGDRKPIGPVKHDLVVQGISAGRIPVDSLVCQVGGAEWVPIRGVEGFSKAFAKLRIDGPTMVDPLPLMPEPGIVDMDEAITMNGVQLRDFDDAPEHTIAEVVHPLRPETIAPSSLQKFEDSSEATVVEEPLHLTERPR